MNRYVAWVAKNSVAKVMSRVFPTYWKEHHELKYWKARKSAESTLSNDHYRHYYTEHFGLDEDFYKGKRILDIGCGPRGSLEWAHMAAKRVGLDSLAQKYMKLGADKHEMEYVASPAEAIPFDDCFFDVVCSFNSLDHVFDVDRSIQEIKRVIRTGGSFLLLVEVNHPATACEPHNLSPSGLTRSLEPELRCLGMEVFKPAESGLYESIAKGEKYSDAEKTTEIGWLSARFVRQ